METLPLINQLFPSYLSKIWKIDRGGGKDRLLTPKGRLRWPVNNIVSRVTTPILTTGITRIETIYHEKIKEFQECWIDLVEAYQRSNKPKQKLSTKMNLAFYNRTLILVKSDPIFATDMGMIIDTVETLRDYEMNIHSMIVKRRTLLEEALNNDINKNDFLNSLYGSYMALVCFWYVARNKRQSERLLPAITKISHKFAIDVDSYIETLDIITNPKEMDMMKRAEQWERQHRPIQKHSLQNR
jgi:hypothetical protein